MNSNVKRVYLPPLEDDPDWGPRVRFRLTYEGPLKASGRDAENGQRDPMAEHKQMIRKKFHGQLKELWQSHKFLREYKVDPRVSRDMSPAEHAQYGGTWGGGKDHRIPMVEFVASNYRENGYRFVPMVRESLSLLCSLDILFLRRDGHTGVISAGDLDNRIKTLIDCLRRPRSAMELRGNEMPAEGEDPFYCLLEDDKLVTQLSVETDHLFLPPIPGKSEEENRRWVNLVITVELKPYNVGLFNLSYV